MHDIFGPLLNPNCFNRFMQVYRVHPCSILFCRKSINALFFLAHGVYEGKARKCLVGENDGLAVSGLNFLGLPHLLPASRANRNASALQSKSQ